MPSVTVAPIEAQALRHGFLPIPSGIVNNVGCPDQTADRLALITRWAVSLTGKPICYSGHSLGGLIAKAVSRRVPQGYVSGVVSMGTPMSDVCVNPLMDQATMILGLANELALARSGCFRGTCGCRFVDDARSDLLDDVTYFSFFTRDDQVVEPEGCLLPESHNCQNIEVAGTHSGLPDNPQVLAQLPTVLAAIFQRRPRITA